ncbi:MAG: TIGR00730 family Rossman fold protein [Alkalispirochaeta sp.]
MRIAIYCGSNTGDSPAFARDATYLAQELARTGHGVVYGGGNIGLMGIVADTMLAAGGEVIGVMPSHLTQREIAHRGITELHETASMHERKAKMIELADGFIALPGGVGTLEELSEVLSWARIGLHTKPMAVLDTGGYYQPLIDFLDSMVSHGFITQRERDLVFAEEDPRRLVRRIGEAAATRKS